jgi:hypothetical protein
MAEYNLTEAEAWTIITQGVNFGITQVVDGNWGVHAVIPKAIFEQADPVMCTTPASAPTGTGTTSSIFDCASENAPLRVLLGIFMLYVLM